MLKLPKGLKKKKKGKKSKKDQELFTEEELEQYRREHQNQQQQPDQQHPGETSAETSKGGTDSTNDDEWQKFNALTAGVDSILKQKQEELEHLKSTSFFQRVPPPSEKLKNKEEKEQRERVEREAKEAEEREKQAQLDKEKAEDVLAGAVVELSESGSEDEEDGDDIFDTTYIDVISAAEVGLVNVDSPPEEAADGPDPFDTSYAEKVIKGPEVSKRGKKLVNIGTAVEVLTGRVESVSVATARRPRRGPQNLLLENFDEAAAVATKVEVQSGPITTLLDDQADEIPDIPIDLSVSLHLQFQKEKLEQEEQHREETVNLDEFDEIKNKRVIEDDDEFAQLAVESLAHRDVVSVLKESDLQVEQSTGGDWAFFENKEKPPRPTVGPNLPAAVSDEDLSFQEDSSDPFDTAFVAKILPATLAEDSDFDPRAETEEPVKVEPQDLLRGTESELSQITVAPIAPTQRKVQELDDPFDTSCVERAVAPGKTELKFLEKELLSESGLKKSLSDPDFDPRADEPIATPHQEKISVQERKSSLVLSITPATVSKVSFIVPATDLLRTEDHVKGHQKPLTPYYTKAPSISENDDKDIDPFDTSFVSEQKPTDIELNLIEKEILNQPAFNRSLSDPDFDPRAVTPQPPIALQPDLLSTGDNEFKSKVLTPAVEVKEFEYTRTPDPFDTSSVPESIPPGEAELKVLVNEFVPQSVEDHSDLLADTQESIFAGKLLTPQPTNSVDEEEDIDPFDTSFASNLQPGQAEIRVIETELIHN